MLTIDKDVNKLLSGWWGNYTREIRRGSSKFHPKRTAVKIIPVRNKYSSYMTDPLYGK